MAEGFMQKLVPHLMVGLEGPRLSEEEKALLASYRFSGVILFDRNVRDARQLMELTREVRGVSVASHGRIPLIAADHEGGIVSYLGRAIGVPPTQMAAARTGDLRLCERLFVENARRMRACGVNMLLAPVADINSERLNPVIGTRSFGENAEIVSSFVSAAVTAARRAGVLACIKHFPGHGPSSVDSHLALPVLGATLEQLKTQDILPFVSGIRAGAETVMVGHIAPRGRSLPASLDSEIIGGLLRGELGFDGVVITDGLEMEGVRMSEPCAADSDGGRGGAARHREPARRRLVDICEVALKAGNDILLFSEPVAQVVGELRACGDSAWGSTFSDGERGEWLKSSGARIERLLAVASQKDREFELPSDSGVYGEIAEKSMHVGQGSGAAALTDPGTGLSVVFYAEQGEFDRSPMRSFVTRVLQGFEAVGEEGTGAGAAIRFGRHVLLPYGSVPKSAIGLEALVFSTATPGATPHCVVLMNRRPLSAQAISEICVGARAVVVAGWPYAADAIPPGPHVLITYGIYDAAADAVRRRLMPK
jgi:beta-glucosidase-like glycosyl hydrolase